jgi:hypothetical protein
MPNFPISNAAARGLALGRATESMLRAMGGGEAMFRVPVHLQDDNPTQQELGLRPVLTDNVAISPVVVRWDASSAQLLISPRSLEAQLLLRAQTAEEFFERTCSVQVQGRSLRIRSYRAEQFAEQVYLYRISAVE